MLTATASQLASLVAEGAPARPRAIRSHAQLVAWLESVRAWALSRAEEEAALATSCDGALCSPAEHAADAADYLATAQAIRA